ncbi:hypothetical protein ACOSP7_031876 [Xanthoceras sorbifolium]
MNKVVNWEAFRSIIPRISRLAQEVKVEVIGMNMFVFTFTSFADRRRVFGRGPWSFDNALLVLEAPLGVGAVANMKFERVMFWVQIHNVPLICMNKEACNYLGGLIGTMADLDIGVAEECFGKYLRVRVWVDVTKLLKHFLRVAIEENMPETVILIKYERLLDFCTHCGYIGHVVKDCLLSPVGVQCGVESSQFGL